jgi:hypothetical protein
LASAAATIDANPDARFDLDDNGQVDVSDHRIWVRKIQPTWIGDANLDGDFDTSDLVSVFQASEYEDAVNNNSTWAEGDWNADGDFSSADIVVAFVDGGYEQGPRNTANAVPEPSTSMLRIICLIGIA